MRTERPSSLGAGGAGGATWIVAALALGLAVFLVRERQLAGAIAASGFPLDDSWIHLQFARNLAEGRGFAFNPGVPVAGSTAPLWTALLAGAFALTGGGPLVAKVLGTLFTLATALLARRLAHMWTQDAGFGLLAGVLTAFSGPLVWGALSGMEVSLGALLVTAALLSATAGRPWMAALLLGLAVLARPEAVLLVPLVWLAGPLTAGRAAVLFGTVALLLTPWVSFDLATTGTPLPATAVAKVEGGLLGILSGQHEPLVRELVVRPWRFEVEWVAWLGSVNVLLPVLLVPGLWWLWRRRGRAVAVPATLLVLHPLGMALLAPYRGPGFQEGRYSIHLLPLAIIVAVAALGWLTPDTVPSWGLAPARWPLPHARRVAPVLLLLASAGAIWPAASRYGWAVQNIEAMQVRLGRWVDRETPRQARVALNDVGAIAYLSRREVVDVMGLVTPAIIPYRRDGDGGVLQYLQRVCPDYLIIFPEWFPALSAETGYFRPIYRVRLDHNTVAGADEMVVYETVWNRWGPSPRPCR